MDQRRRQLANIKTALVERLVFAGKCLTCPWSHYLCWSPLTTFCRRLHQDYSCRARFAKYVETLHKCWFIILPSSTTLDQHNTNIGSNAFAVMCIHYKMTLYQYVSSNIVYFLGNDQCLFNDIPTN